MEPVSLLLLQKPATCHYIEHCCVTVARNGGGKGGFSFLTTVRTKPDVIIHDIESQKFINISEYLGAAMYS
jgi:hypothetical protein